MKRSKYLLFDLDGTITDSEEAGLPAALNMH